MPITPKKASLLFLFAGLVGFLDATYLTLNHYLGVPLPCSIVQGCEKVTTSYHALIGGVPVALLGALYYLSILILVVAYFDTKRLGILNFIARFSVVGFLASLWFLFLQIFIIKAICLYCLVSALTSTLIFVVGLLVIKAKYTYSS